MSLKYHSWPEDRATLYRQKGYWTDEPLFQMLEPHSRNRPAQLAIIAEEQILTYAELDLASTRLAKQWLAQGVRAGDTALVQLPNIPAFYVVYFAMLKAGIVPVNALFNHNKIELNAYATQIKPSLLILSQLHVLFQQNEYLPVLQSQCQQPNVLAFRIQSCWEELLDESVDTSAVTLPVCDASDIAFFQLSGGSTGTPKLIPRTHNDYLYSVRESARICQVTPHTRYLCALPIAHNYPMSSPGALGVFWAGGTVVLARDPSPATCFPIIDRHYVTMTSLVPTALRLWLESIQTRPETLRSLEVLQVGGAHLPPSIAAQVKPVLRCKLQQVFGMAEGLVNYTRLNDSDWVCANTQGRPISPDDEIRIVDEEDYPVPPGMAGALQTRGPYTFQGYFQAEEHNRKAFTADGFYRTGDRVSMTEQGYLVVEGREKDQINRGGEKIAAEEVESWLIKHPDVAQVALVPVADDAMGEKSCAFIVSQAPIKAVVLRKFLREQGLADYKIPDRFEFVPSLPLTAVGKINKVKLKALLHEQQMNAIQTSVCAE
jgi:2,3-dihydroxybenzoate-AMP ligase